MSLQITPELGSIVLAFGVDWIAYRMLGERLTLKRFKSALAGGFVSFMLWTLLSSLKASWTPGMMVLIGAFLLIVASSKSTRQP